MSKTPASEATTDGIRITVKPRYIEDGSNPTNSAHCFAYEVTITNVGDRAARLVSRHWIITDGHGAQQHVRGPGVVGKQPRLQPGESFRYESFCPLETPEGAMHGTFHMLRDDGTTFDADVATFSFSVPRPMN